MTKVTTACFVIMMGVVGFAGVAPAQNLVDPFGPGAVSLGLDDLALMRQSIEKVLKANRTGAVAEWKSAKGEIAGRSTLRNTFAKNGLPCGEVEHVFTIGEGHRYLLPFCQVKGGEWKLAF